MPIRQVGEPLAQPGIAVPAGAEDVRVAGNGPVTSSKKSVAARVVLGVFTLGISEGIRAIVRACRRGADPVPRLAVSEVLQSQQQALPRAEPAADVANRMLAENLKKLPPEGALQAAIREGLAPYAEAFGPTYGETGLEGLPFKGTLLFRLRKAVTASADRVTPEGLRAITQQVAPRVVGDWLLEEMIRTYGTAHGLTDSNDIETMKVQVIASAPDFLSTLQDCRDLTTLRSVVESLRPRVEARVNLNEAILQTRKEVGEAIYREFSTQTGVEESVVRRELSLKKLESQFNAFGEDILNGKKALEPRLYQEAAGRFVSDKIELFNAVGNRGLSESVRIKLQERVLTNPNFKGIDLIDKCVQAARSVDCRSLLRALHDPAADKELVAGLLESTALRLMQVLRNVYGTEAWSKFDVDAQAIVREAVLLVLVGMHPDVETALAGRAGLADEVMHVLDEGEMAGIDAASSGSMPEVQARMLISATGGAKVLLTAAQTALINSQALTKGLSDGQLPPLFADVIEKNLAAVRRDFPNQLPEGTLEAFLKCRSPAGDTIGARLKHEVAAAGHPLTLAEVGALLRRELRLIVNQSLVKEAFRSVAEENHWEFSEVDITDAVYQLFKRFPDLHDRLNRAENEGDARRACQAYFAETPVCREMLRVRHDLLSAWSDGKTRLYGRIAEVTGRPIEEIQHKLKLGKINESGKFGYFRKDCYDALVKPDVNRFTSTEAIRAKIDEFIEQFVTEKTALWSSVDIFEKDFALDPTLAANWKENVLTLPTLDRRDFFANCIAIAGEMSSAALEAAFGNEKKLRKTSDDELLALFYSLADKQLELPQRVFAGKELGSDEKGLIRQYTREVFLSRNPGLAVVKAHPDVLRRLSGLAEERAYELQRSISQLDDEEALRAGNEMTKYVLVVGLIDAMLTVAEA